MPPCYTSDKNNEMVEKPLFNFHRHMNKSSIYKGCSRGRHCMAVGFTTTMQSKPVTTKVVCSNPVQAELYSIQHYVIKFVNALRQVGCFLQALRFPPTIKRTATI
jgi:hypothetical protein